MNKRYIRIYSNIYRKSFKIKPIGFIKTGKVPILMDRRDNLGIYY